MDNLNLSESKPVREASGPHSLHNTPAWFWRADKKPTGTTPLEVAHQRQNVSHAKAKPTVLAERSATSEASQKNNNSVDKVQELINKSDFWKKAGPIDQWPNAVIKLLNANHVEEAVNKMQELLDAGRGNHLKEVLDKNKRILRNAREQGYAALHYSAEDAKHQTLLMVIDSGMDIKIKSLNGWTALDHAMSFGQLKAAEILLQEGAKPTATTHKLIQEHSWTQRAIQLLNRYKDIDEALKVLKAKEHEKAVKLMQNICERGGQEAMKKMLGYAPNPLNVKDKAGHTPVYYAITHCHNKALQVLIHSGARAEDQDESGANFMHVAASVGNSEAFEILVREKELKFKASLINASGKEGMTPLHMAVLGNHSQAVKKLLELGAYPHCSDTQHRTPLDYARRGEKALIIEILKTAEKRY